MNVQNLCQTSSMSIEHISGYLIFHCITVTSQWGQMCLKSPASRLFNQSFIQTQIKENIKAPRHWPLCGEFTGEQWIPHTNASYTENASIWWRHHGGKNCKAKPQVPGDFPLQRASNAEGISMSWTSRPILHVTTLHVPATSISPSGNINTYP